MFGGKYYFQNFHKKIQIHHLILIIIHLLCWSGRLAATYDYMNVKLQVCTQLCTCMYTCIHSVPVHRYRTQNDTVQINKSLFYQVAAKSKASAPPPPPPHFSCSFIPADPRRSSTKQTPPSPDPDESSSFSVARIE